jgi:hypothetical protein
MKCFGFVFKSPEMREKDIFKNHQMFLFDSQCVAKKYGRLIKVLCSNLVS